MTRSSQRPARSIASFSLRVRRRLDRPGEHVGVHALVLRNQQVLHTGHFLNSAHAGKVRIMPWATLKPGSPEISFTAKEILPSLGFVEAGQAVEYSGLLARDRWGRSSIAICFSCTCSGDAVDCQQGAKPAHGPSDTSSRGGHPSCPELMGGVSMGSNPACGRQNHHQHHHQAERNMRYSVNHAPASAEWS